MGNLLKKSISINLDKIPVDAQSHAMTSMDEESLKTPRTVKFTEGIEAGSSEAIPEELKTPLFYRFQKYRAREEKLYIEEIDREPIKMCE